MNIKKILYSKCPKCHKHGISAIKFGYHGNPDLKCKFCHQVFSVNFAFSLICIFGISIVGGIIILKIQRIFSINIPLWLACAILLIVYFVINYFSPMEEKEISSSKFNEENQTNKKALNQQECDSLYAKYENDLNYALLKYYDKARLIKFFNVEDGTQHIDTFCLIDVGDRLDLASIVTYDGGESLDLILLVADIQIPYDYSVKSVVSNHQIAFYISDQQLNNSAYKNIVEYSHNNLNYWIGIKHINSSSN